MKLTLISLILSYSFVASADLTVMTDRPTSRFIKAAELFQAETGQNVVFVEGAYPQLLAQLQEKSDSADLIMTKDLVLVADLKAKGLLQSLPAVNALNNVHASMKDPDGQWTALTMRTRTLVYNPATVDASLISSYADLANSEWEGRLCLRTSRADYNVALVGGFLVNYGSEKTKEILTGWIGNLPHEALSKNAKMLNTVASETNGIFNNDTELLNAIATGVCDVGIANHYYLAQLLNKQHSFPVKIKFLNQTEADGVLTNGSNIGMIKDSPQADLAQKFIEILLRDEIQLSISGDHFEYPAIQGLAPSTLIKEWGKFDVNPASWSEIGAKASEAKELMGEVGYK